jgi:hypothetical protein
MCDRPLNGVTWPTSQRGSGRGLQQAAKSFPTDKDLQANTFLKV